MIRRTGFVLAGVCAFAIVAPAYGQIAQYNIPAGDLKTALDTYSLQSNSEIIYKVEEVRGVRSAGVRGAMSPGAALDAILARTGFAVRRDGSGALAIVRASADPKADAGAESVDGDIVVTGSRIRGAPVASPVISVTQEEMRNTGQNSLGDVARNLPQSFSGGQNPGVTIGALGVGNENVTSASTLNLRGLGPDATLTLLNGHRLAYDSVVQGIDISTIPIAALERLEIVADGASAIYGSDAVGGVANIVLKKDYDGLSTTARFGASTDGGNSQHQFSAVGGATWAAGGVIATLDYQRDTPVLARQRSYTTRLNDDQMLLPYRRQYNAVISAHHAVAETVKLSADLTYSNRRATRANALRAADPPTVHGTVARTTTEAFSVSPRIEIELPQGWGSALSGTFAQDNTELNTERYQNGVQTQRGNGPYNNTLKMIELSGEGPLFTLGNQTARLAIGLGYRSNNLKASIATITPTQTFRLNDFSKNRDSHYAFAELFVPFVGAGDSTLINRLAVTGALRYEKYPGMAELATPKFGVIFAPISGLEIKSSWGKSFKAPTLFQENRFQEAILDAASVYAPEFPPAATAITRYGGNSELKPERATSWTTTLSVKPNSLPQLNLEVSYFDVRYKNRIVEPIQVRGAVFNNPAYQILIDYNPSLAQITEAVDAAIQGLQAATTIPYDPANVVAIVDNRYVNLASQNIRGLDFSADYWIEDESIGRLAATATASYLLSTQKIVFNQPSADLSGTIFDPPRWRGRAGLTWSRQALTLNGSVNYIGSLKDDRTLPNIRIGSITTADFTARYRNSQDGSLLGGWDVALSVQNAFNVKPRIIRTTAAQVPPYDSTNHSVIGRFVSLSLTKAW